MGRDIETDVYNICINSKGGITREEGFRLSHKERKEIVKIINKINSPN